MDNKISAIEQDTKKEIFELDFGEIKLAPPIGKDAFNNDKTDYGRYGKNDVFYADGKVTLTWKGIVATVSGALNWVDHAKDAPKLSKDGNYFAFALTSYFNGKDITVNKKTAKDTDWVCLVGNKPRLITVACEDTDIAIFDLRNTTLNRKS